jgi:diguanylate cyclase (GGDEF)-like protein
MGMREGKYEIKLPIRQADDVGILGEELNRLALHLERNYAHARKMQEVTDAVVGGLLLDDVLDRIFDSFQAVIPFNRLGCALISEDQLTISTYWARADYTKLHLPNGFKARLHTSSLNNIMHTGQPRILNDLQAYLLNNPGSHSTRLIVAEGIRSSLTCPLISQGKPVGFIFFSSSESHTYQDVHQGIFRQLATQISALIEKSRLYQEIVEINRKLAITQQELQNLATRDQLTGIYNRRGILELIEAAVAKARRESSRLALIMVDLDHFKCVNDSGGHKAGDNVLREVVSRMTASVREYNYLGRLGGEEFIILLDEADCDHAPFIAERLRSVVSIEPIRSFEKTYSVTISLGVVQAIDLSKVTSAEKLISIADEALYESKRNGRNRVTCHQATG